MNIYGKLFIKEKYSNFYHRYAFLKYFPSSRGAKFRSLYLNSKNEYFNIICEGFNIKFSHYPYQDSIPLCGYLKEFDICRGDVVVDGGAYQGVFALVASKMVGDEGKVIAFEPDSENYKKLIENIKLNDVKNIIPLNKGLWNEDSILKFNNANNEASSFIFDDVDTPMDVPVVSLDNELERLNIDNLDFLKLDVEGVELEVVEGSNSLLNENNVKIAIASYHIVNGQRTFVQLEKALSNRGYSTKTDFPEHLTTYASK